MGAITTEVVDTGEKRDKRGHRVLPPAERGRLIAAYQGSGLTMAEFARRESLNYNTLAGWITKAGRPAAATGPIKFAQVQLPVAAGASRSGGELEVRLPDGTMLRGGRVAELAALIRALRS